MKWLTINCDAPMPSFGVVEDGRRYGTLRMLDWREIPEFAKWIGVAGGRDLLDAFEVALINSGALRVWPIDEIGTPLHDECECVSLEHGESGIQLLWTPKLTCDSCGGQGHFAALGDEVMEEDVCTRCDGDGWLWGAEFATDMDGNAIAETIQ